MKKWWVGLVLAVELAACGGGSGGTNQTIVPDRFSVGLQDQLTGDAAETCSQIEGFNDTFDRADELPELEPEAVSALDYMRNSFNVFPDRYTRQIPENFDFWSELVPYAERMERLCDRDLDQPVATGVTAPPITSPPVSTQPPPSPAAYDLTGTGTVMVTLNNETGGIEQFTTPLPYHRDLATVPDFLYISAQLQGSGEVTCQVRNRFAVIQTATSSGQYVIATCSGSG